MIHGFHHLAFIGPGGPEFLVVMLVLLMMFGAKDAPRILRKLNEIINQIRNTADGFKREVMYGDLARDIKEAVNIDEDKEEWSEEEDDEEWLEEEGKTSEEIEGDEIISEEDSDVPKA